MADEKDRSGKQKAAEADVEDVEENLGPFVVAAETTRMPMVFTNAKVSGNPIIFVNQAFLTMTGFDEDAVLGQNFDFLIERESEPEALVEIQTAFEGGRGLETPVRIHHKDGNVFWVSIFISPVRDKAGTIVQHFASFVDMTRHKQEENRLRLLLDELNHRTQNAIATIQSIAVQTLRGTDSHAVDAFEGRILALGTVHALLGRDDWDSLSLREVIEQILEPFGLEGRHSPRFTIRGAEVRLRPKAALILAMAFNELATNAVRHGALSHEAAGQVDIVWHVESTPQGSRMRLRWQERGGPPVAPPRHKGFGSRLIGRGLAQELDGDVSHSYEPAGVVCTIMMPVPETDQP